MKKKKVLATALLLASAFLPLASGAASRLLLPERVGQTQAPSLAELRKRAEAGDVEAQYSLFLQYQEGKSSVEARAEAVGWLRKAAEAGHETAQVSLGLLYREGKRGVARNPEEAVKWFRKSAEQGNASGESELGLMYERGEGVAKDETEAVRWYTRAADHGLPIAKFDLAFMYEQGHGVPVDVDKAIALYEESAFSIPTARRNLAILYHDGKLRPKDLAAAYKWALLDVSAEERRALKEGMGEGEDFDPKPRLGYALVLLEDFAKGMSKREKENGLRMAQDWIRSNAAHLGDEPQTFPETLKHTKKK
jgi:TPR repeat protein